MRRVAKKATASTLYISRKLLNAVDIVKWAKAQGFPTTQLPSDMHVTIAYSKTKIVWPEPHDALVTIVSPAGRHLELLGDSECVGLRFESADLTARWESLLKVGASWGYPTYKPHVTLSWSGEVDLAKIKAYTGRLEFGPEVFAEIDEGWRDTHVEKQFGAELKQAPRGPLSFAEALAKVGARHTRAEFKQIQEIHDQAVSLGATCDHDNVVDDDEPVEKVAKFCKVDEELGLVFGWAIICKVGKRDYVDTQGDHIPEESMLSASVHFMLSDRIMKEMHVGDKKGTIVFAFPVTGEIAKAMGLKVKKTGLMIAVKPDDPDVLAKFKSGEYTGFSIGGSVVTEEEAT